MLMLFACQTPKESREELSLAGCWELRLDSTDVTEQVQLPGTTDTNQKGYPNNDKEETTHLSRPFRYQGKAWYQKEITIPENWEGKSIWLILERTKPTQIWVDICRFIRPYFHPSRIRSVHISPGWEASLDYSSR